MEKTEKLMPAEWELHKGTIMIWPHRPGSWPHGAKAAGEAFKKIIEEIAENELVYVAVNDKTRDIAEKEVGHLNNVILFEQDTDDAWARDIGPTFVRDGGEVLGVNWTFNAWGGEYNGLYSSWEKDDAFATAFLKRFDYAAEDASPFVLEGGSIHSDGEGTIMVTEACLLSRGRNQELSKEQIEQKLEKYLGAKKVLWLPRGIYNDETDEHVDNVCAFVAPAEVVLAWTDNENDPQYEMSKACLDYLEKETDAMGRKITVHKLPIPEKPICIGEKDLEGYIFEEGEDKREAGERLAASYVNFYFSNGKVIMPVFGEENSESDEQAIKILESVCRGRRIVPVMARDILVGGGNIHCITQQVIQSDNHK